MLQKGGGGACFRGCDNNTVKTFAMTKLNRSESFHIFLDLEVTIIDRYNPIFIYETAELIYYYKAILAIECSVV